MAKKSGVNRVKKQQQKAMKKRQKDKVRHKSHSTTVVSENAVQFQMISEFGNVQNFVKNVQNLAKMFREDEDLMKLRFDPDKIYAHVDLQEDRDALEDMYQDDDLFVYDEQYEDLWKGKRKTALEEQITDEMVEQVDATFKKLVQTKKGFKKEYRAAMAGKLLIESHITSLTEAPAHENALWEIMFNAALKENKKELPPPVEKTEEAPAETPVEEAAPAEAPATEESE